MSDCEIRTREPGPDGTVAWPDRSMVEAAAERIRPHVVETPLEGFSAIDDMLGCELLLKGEHRQAGGAFKARGACNAVFSLDEAQASRGVATHSSGNHAAALARAASLRGIPAHVVMPRDAARPKREATARWGARIIDCEATMESRIETLDAVMAETGARLVHPYEDTQVMAGQGTVALELLPALRESDCVLVPLGGGGLISGMSLFLAEARPGLRIIGVEPAGADDALRSLESGVLTPVRPDTIADGLRATIGRSNLAIVRRHVDQVVTVSDAAIREAMRLLWQLAGQVVEPSGAVTLAALLEGRVKPEGRAVGVVTGGNVDRARFPFLAETPL